jgi:hypothetical protein
MSAQDDILTFEASREALGLDEGELFLWVSEGRLRAYRMDPAVRFRAADLDALVARRKASRGRRWVGLAQACELSGYDADALMRFMIDGAVSAYRSDRDIYFRKDEMRLLRMAGSENGHAASAVLAPARDGDRTCDLDEAATRTGLSRWELASLVDSGELTPVDSSAQMVFRRSEVEALRSQRAAAAELAAAGGPADELLRLSARVGFRFGPGGTSAPEAIRDRVRALAREHDLAADTLEDLITGLEGLLADAATRNGDDAD